MKIFYFLFFIAISLSLKSQNLNLNRSYYTKNLFESIDSKIEFYAYYSFQIEKVQNANLGFDSDMRKIKNDIEYFEDPAYHYDITPNVFFYLGAIYNFHYCKKTTVYHNF